MNPFDLTKALDGEPLVTRGGMKAVNFCRDERRTKGDLLYQFELQDATCSKFHCTDRGTYWVNKPDSLDLFMGAE